MITVTDILKTFNLPKSNVYVTKKTSKNTWSLTNHNGKEYVVTKIKDKVFCTCPDSMFRHNKVCKHRRMLGI
jgi:hypothetical protein